MPPGGRGGHSLALSAADTEPADSTLPRVRRGEHREKGAKLKPAANMLSTSVSQKNISALI